MTLIAAECERAMKAVNLSGGGAVSGGCWAEQSVAWNIEIQNMVGTGNLLRWIMGKQVRHFLVRKKN